MSEEQTDLLVSEEKSHTNESVNLSYFDNPFTTTVKGPSSQQSIIGEPLILPAIPYDYFLFSTLSTVFGFFPIGIFALWNSRQVYRCSARGDLIGAKKSANNARILSWMSFIVAIFLFVIIALTIMIARSKQ
ncbi:proline-rich transmembrane protein 1-like [Saccoglossus kowalevskii]|uniref:Uncharacterized protein LOC100379004 n=1 Tax=Saccoglossus kowalevskii TaxID=10224 RepID=A0ABM0GKX9_SACKO|nr:PREDICTED: uncharacterized protein LOC100379004 [Saccoglossus kowalevskii]